MNIGSGKLGWRGNEDSFDCQHLGSNSIDKIPRKIANHLGLEGVFTFHSLCRSSALAATNQGSTNPQMTSFYGWSNEKMAQEYYSSSNLALEGMANRLVVGLEGSKCRSK